MKAAEVRELGNEELTARLDETREELFNLRFQQATGQLENYGRLGQVRRDIARILSTQRERELGISVEPALEELERSRSRREREKEEQEEEAPKRRRGLRRGREEDASEAEPEEAAAGSGAAEADQAAEAEDGDDEE